MFRMFRMPSDGFLHSFEACLRAGEEQKPSPAVIPAKETVQKSNICHS